MLRLRRTPTLKTCGYAAMAIFVGAYAWMAFRGPEGIPSLLGKWDEIRSLQVENANLSQEVEQYEVRIERLTKSQEEQELEFRKRLDMMKPGELQFKLQGKPAPSEVPPAPTATEQ